MDGLEGDTRDARAGLFGENVIDIDEKSVFKLLIDEVVSFPCPPNVVVRLLIPIGPPPVLHLPSLQYNPLGRRRILLLRRMYFPHQHHKRDLHAAGNALHNAPYASHGTAHLLGACPSQWILADGVVGRSRPGGYL